MLKMRSRDSGGVGTLGRYAIPIPAAARPTLYGQPIRRVSMAIRHDTIRRAPIGASMAPLMMLGPIAQQLAVSYGATLAIASASAFQPSVHSMMKKPKT